MLHNKDLFPAKRIAAAFAMKNLEMRFSVRLTENAVGRVKTIENIH